jgi:hypothetical protein
MLLYIVHWLLLPMAGTRKDDVAVSITPQRLTVRLAWAGRVLDGPLKKRIKASEACWALDSSITLTWQELQARLPNAAQHKALGSTGGGVDGHAAQQKAAAAASGLDRPAGVDAAAGQQCCEFVELLVVLPKEEGGHYWRALFEGGEEKSHMEVRRGDGAASSVPLLFWLSVLVGCLGHF